MTEVIIKTDIKTLVHDAKVIKVKAGLYRKGIDKFPRELMEKKSPFKTFEATHKWLVLAQNVWAGRSRNNRVLETLQEILSESN